jgi:hypothetical protein
LTLSGVSELVGFELELQSKSALNTTQKATTKMDDIEDYMAVANMT